ncbi:hypothetical protein [Nonomuraea sp. NPDC003804]|uniref:hypothetical protein n=1 Tax=Nonomuraea sp. NPDC003804 TaxID=3154547 RepID=UPI0033B53CDC
MITLTATVLMFRGLGSEKPAYALSATAGVLDSMANLLFLLAGLGAAALAVSLLALT